MAEVGLAFLSAVLGVVFDKMASPGVVGFLNRRKQTEALLKKLEMALLPLNVVLEDAEEKEVTNPNVERWIDELKDVAYTAEDILDEIATEALRRQLHAEFKPVVGKCTIVPLGNGWINDGKRLNNKKPRGRGSKRRNQGLVAVLGGQRRGETRSARGDGGSERRPGYGGLFSGDFSGCKRWRRGPNGGKEKLRVWRKRAPFLVSKTGDCFGRGHGRGGRGRVNG